MLGARVPGLLTEGRHAVSLFANIIGGPGMNSLLNIELRERRGLVYSVEASNAMFTGCGLLAVYFGCDPEDLGRCLELCRKVFCRLADGGFSPRKLEKARKQYLGQLAIASENSENRIMAAARATLFRGHPGSPEQTAAAISAVTVDDIARTAHAMCEASSLIFTNNTNS